MTTTHPGPPMGGPFAMAMQRTSFLALVRVELRKLAGTLSDRILLVLAPFAIIGITVLVYTSTRYASDVASVGKQITPAFYSMRLGHALLQCVLIKLIAGEWQHRSAQPALLAQPSRRRYFLAQATVVLIMWVGASTLQIVTLLLIAPGSVTGVGASYLLSYRVGWVIGVVLLGTLLTMLVALTVSMLLPNAAGALSVYVLSVLALWILSSSNGEVFIWLDPMALASTLAGTSPVNGPGPAIVSLLIWVGLLALAGYQVSKRDVG